MADGYIMRRGGAGGGNENGGEKVTGTFTGDGTLTVVIPELAGKTAFVIYLDNTNGSAGFMISMVSYSLTGTYCVIAVSSTSGVQCQGYSSEEYPSYAMTFDVDTGTLKAFNPVMVGFLSGATYRFESIE